jgi:hypothetical protein
MYKKCSEYIYIQQNFDTFIFEKEKEGQNEMIEISQFMMMSDEIESKL